MAFVWEIIRLGLGNLRRHMLRSILTALGIILGVAAVIANGGIGEGAKAAALAQLERLGAKNIIVRSSQPAESQQGQGSRSSFTNRFGLTRADMRVLDEQFSGQLEAIVPLKEVGGQMLRGPLRLTSQAFGTTPDFLKVANLRVARGRYLTQDDLNERAMVAVIGDEVARKFFSQDEDPLGATIRIDSRALKVVGILAPVGLAGGQGAGQSFRDINQDLHLPITTANEVFGDLVYRFASGNRSLNAVEVSEVYFTAPDRESVLAYAEMIRRAVEVRRPGMKDVTMIVPFELLEEARRTARLWQLVLGAIAGISLLVGGIGIMNIMLASVTERTREIGIRRALGATKRHIVWQFLVETGVLSVIGGVIGVASGVSFTLLIGWGVQRLHSAPLIGAWFPATADLPTRVTGFYIILAFCVATVTGVVFGLYPAMMAARQDPIQALRHD